MKFHDRDLDPLAAMLREITDLPEDQLAEFAVVLATIDEEGRAGGRLISSTPNLRAVAQMLELALSQVENDLDKLAGLS